MKTKRPYAEMLPIAEAIKAQLEPFCERIEIAGSIRRKKELIGDIEIVLIPKPYNTGIFADGIASVIDTWKFSKGVLPCKAAQRILPDGTQVDIFICTKNTWALNLAIRTGSAKYSHEILAKGWVKRGCISKDAELYFEGLLYPIPLKEEKDLFEFINVPYCEPEHRNL